MKEQETMLKSYRKEIEVLSLTVDIPQYAIDDEKRNWFPKYEDVLLKVFNNKRENKDILKIINYYGSNKLTVHINLTLYLEDSYSSKEECIEHLKDWLTSGLDVSNDMVEQNIYKGYVYSINDYENNMKCWDKEKDMPIENYVELQD